MTCTVGSNKQRQQSVGQTGSQDTSMCFTVGLEHEHFYTHHRQQLCKPPRHQKHPAGPIRATAEKTDERSVREKNASLLSYLYDTKRVLFF